MSFTWLLQNADAQPDLRRGALPAGLLSPAESQCFEALKTPKRRHDWLLGRWTAKHLVQAVIGQGHALDTLIIMNGADGAPYLPEYPQFDLSISHSHGFAFCALVTDGRVGADIECVTPRSRAFIEDYFTPAEVAAVDGAPPERQNLMATAIWSAKEAALKALRLGLRVDTRAVECALTGSAAPATAWQPLVVATNAQRLGRAAAPMHGVWRVFDRFVLTLVQHCSQTQAAPGVQPDAIAIGQRDRIEWR
jgi:4'-phosphopantetheinyl transferase